MASCNNQADCTGQEVCSDGECVPAKTPEPREIRRTFAGARGEYGGKIAGEQKMLDEFGDFLTDQLDEAVEAREEQKESSGFWGTVGSIVGFGLGCLFGPGGCVKGAGIGSLIGRGGADYVNDAESYRLTEDEFARLDPSELKFLKGTYEDLLDDARDMQTDLDKYDDNEWKQHVLGAISDTWTAYTVASFGEVLWEKGAEVLAEESVKEPITGLLESADPLATFADTTPTLLDQIETGGPIQ